MADQSRSSLRNRILAAVGAVLIVVIALGLFMGATRDRIVEQNSSYLESSTQQTARRIDDLLTNSLNSVRTAALIFEDNLTSPEVSIQGATAMVKTTNFDYMTFTTVDGICHIDSGVTGNALGREYYERGMNGEAGVCAITDSFLNEGNMVMFYAPLYYNNEIVGVLSGVYGEETLSEFVTTYFFGVQTTTFICAYDGTIIGSSTVTPSHYENIFDAYENAELNDISLEELESNFQNGVSSSFTYESASGLGNAYSMKLPSYDWIVMRTFPESITSEMMKSSTRAGLILVAGVFIAFALLVIVIFVQSYRRQKKLLLERQHATRIIDASTNLFTGMVAADLKNGTYEYLKGDRIAGRVPASGSYDILLENWVDITLEQDKADVREKLEIEGIRKELSQDIPFIQFEFRAKRPDKVRWLQVAILCLDRDEEDIPQGALLAVQDVTQAKEAELEAHEALEDAYRAAENASKAKSDFLNSMSHDIRTPMNSIMGLTAIASMYVEDTERVKECLKNISSASKHLLALINEVLDMAKIESGSISLSEEEFDIPEAIEDLLTIVRPQVAAKDLNLNVEIDDIKHEHVIGDPMRLQQVFVNIMGNSVKFTPEGGSLGLRIKELPSRISECGCYEFTFSDTGCGMSPEFLKTVFEPFTRANDSRVTKVEGTGLGMSIVKSVVSLMSGTIDVESELGKGTTFTVTVHLKLRDAPQKNLEDVTDTTNNMEVLESCEYTDRRVLLVEDNAMAAAIAEELLGLTGAEVDHAENGKIALDKLKEQAPNTYDIILMDIQMPIMNGYQTTEAIRECGKSERPDLASIPIIALSADAFSEDIKHAKSVGMNAHVSKPLEIETLVKALAQWMPEK